MKRVIGALTKLCEAYLPDAFVFCLILTLIVFAAGLAFTPHDLLSLTDFWAKDFWSLNAFAMQMIFVLVSGNLLATAPWMKRRLLAVASIPKNEAQGLVLISLFSILACWINWGFGLIVSGLLATEVAKRLQTRNFGLMVATAYSGFLVWHGGLSGSIPLKIAGNDEILARFHPGLQIPLVETIFSTTNLSILLLLAVALPIVSLLMRGDTGERLKVVVDEEESPVTLPQEKSLRAWLENSRSLNLLIFCFFLVAVVRDFLRSESLDINRVNFIFLACAILLHGTPRQFLRSLSTSFGTASGIAIQFPFYAGIMGVMQYSGLAELVSAFFVSVSTPRTLPLWSFLSGGIVNFFVPSGGGQWVVQGPIMLKAAKEMGVSPAQIALAISWGDAWTNMIQPFWTLPLLALAKVELKAIMGFCLIYLFASGVIITSVIYFAGLFRIG